MKNKIKVMRDPHDITDQELERFKDFDSLLTQHQKLLKNNNAGLWKGLGAVVVVSLTLTTYLILKTDDVPPATKEVSSIGIDRVGVKQEPSTLEVATDSSASGVGKEATSPQVVEKKQSVHQEANDIHAPVEEKSTAPVSESSGPVEKQQSLSKKSESVYIQAEPVEGYEALYSYFNKELIYPELAIKDSIQGVLTVTFLINKDGKPEQIQTSGVLGEAFDQEAIRLIENMPAWKPATLNGRVVVSKLTLPLTFQLK
ncbi:MAG TPA: energy transducer TonB [Cyclobacteriaceae bacterium]